MKAIDARKQALESANFAYEKAIKQIKTAVSIGGMSIELVVPSAALLERLRTDGYTIERNGQEVIISW